MNKHRLTWTAKTAIRRNMKRKLFVIFTLPLLGAPAGCVQIAAPDKPIEINLNIRIEQEVVLRIEGAVKDAIAENSEIF